MITNISWPKDAFLQSLVLSHVLAGGGEGRGYPLVSGPRYFSGEGREKDIGGAKSGVSPVRSKERGTHPLQSAPTSPWKGPGQGTSHPQTGPGQVCPLPPPPPPDRTRRGHAGRLSCVVFYNLNEGTCSKEIILLIWNHDSITGRNFFPFCNHVPKVPFCCHVMTEIDNKMVSAQGLQSCHKLATPGGYHANFITTL